MDAREVIARRAALEIQDGDVVNLGIGIPTMVANFIPEDVHAVFQSENGIMGMNKMAAPEEQNPDIVNAGAAMVTVKDYASFFDSALSFAIIRGGHLDLTILGALEIDQEGTLARHIIPGKMVPGMGGAMDLVAGAKKVIVVTTHTARGDAKKILKTCKLPLTAYKKVHKIVTELAVFDITKGGLLLIEKRKGVTVDEIREKTEAEFQVSHDLKDFGPPLQS